MNFNGNALFFKKFAHLRADIVERVNRRNWEITAFDSRTMAAVGAVHILAVAPIAFFTFDFEEAATAYDDYVVAKENTKAANARKKKEKIARDIKERAERAQRKADALKEDIPEAAEE